MTAAKVFFTGTHRTRAPEDTWRALSGLLADYGITRIADVTGLDTIGIPVVMAVRPLARTLSVSQGKGQTLLLAKISAAMEAIEFWHAENAHPPLVRTATPARELHLPYLMDDVAASPESLITEDTPLDWVDAVGMVERATVAVPAELVTMPPDRRPWSPPGFVWSSNGMAAGNNAAEAGLHALYEIIERDAVARRPGMDGLDYVDPESMLTEAAQDCAQVVEGALAAGATLTVRRVPSRFDVPCFGATVWSPEFPVTCQGWGAHLDPHVAVSRALTEAVQSRLTAISGTRDDLPPVYRYLREDTGEPLPPQVPLHRWQELTPVGPGAFDDIAEELAWVSAKVREVTGHEPLARELGVTDAFAVVRVLAPGTDHSPTLLHSSR